MLSDHDRAQIQQEVARAYHTLVIEKGLHPAAVLAVMHSSVVVNAAAMFGPVVAIESAENAIRLIESLAIPVPPVELEGRVH